MIMNKDTRNSGIKRVDRASRLNFLTETNDFMSYYQNNIAIFSIFRSYIEHEDSLINQRMTWLLTLNSFIFASISLLIDNLFDDNLFFSSPHISAVKYFVIGLAVIGGISSIFTFFSVSAAFNSIRAIKDIWIAKYEFPSFSSNDNIYELTDTKVINNMICMQRYDRNVALPYIKGGGPRKKTTFYGKLISMSFITGIGLFWSLTIIYIVLYV